MAKDPSMPFYVNDWLSSGRVLCMTLEQQGAYVRLLCHCWASQDASIPDDDQALAVLSGMGEGWLKNGCPLVRRCFTPHPQLKGCLTNERIYALWEERQIWREKSRKGGQKSAANRRRNKGLSTSKGGSKGGPATVKPVVGNYLQPNGNTPSSSSSSFNTPTPTLGAPSKNDSTPQWGEEEEDLISRKVARAPDAIKAAISNGCQPVQVHDLIAHYDAHQPAWSAGALYSRLLALRPGQDVATLWPEPAKEARDQQRREQRQADDAEYLRKREDQAKQVQADRQAADARVATLESRHGDVIDMLDRQGLIDLIRQAEPANPEFHLRRFGKTGLTQSLRVLLLEYLEVRSESIVKSQTQPHSP